MRRATPNSTQLAKLNGTAIQTAGEAIGSGRGERSGTIRFVGSFLDRAPS
jgi:hypothetical protein